MDIDRWRGSGRRGWGGEGFFRRPFVLLLTWPLFAVEMILEYDGGGWVVSGFEVSDGTLCPVSAGSGA